MRGGIEVEIKEAIEKLSLITANEIKIGNVTCQQIPDPKALGAKLLEAAGVKLPKEMPSRNLVATRKKLVNRRK